MMISSDKHGGFIYGNQKQQNWNCIYDISRHHELTIIDNIEHISMNTVPIEIWCFVIPQKRALFEF